MEREKRMNYDAATHVNFDAQWEMPVVAEASNTSIVTITGPAGAFEFLTTNWSHTRGPAHGKAKRAVMSAIAGRSSAEDARAAFVSACLAAGCLVQIE
jgi:hypothetical protein